MADSPQERLEDMNPEKLETLVEHADTLQELAEARENNSISRRDALAVGLGALAGGSGAASAIGGARGEASQSNQWGDAGEPGDPMDMFANGVNIYDGPNNQVGSLDETGLDIPAVSTGQVNNEKSVPPSADLQAEINDLNSEYGSGIIYLEAGTPPHSLANIDVPDGIIIDGKSASPNEGVTVEPAEDAPIFIPHGGTPQIRNVFIDVSTVSGYSSDAIAIRRSNGIPQNHVPVVENVRVVGDQANPSGTGIAVVDDDGAGIHWLITRDTSFKFLAEGIRNESNAGGWVQGVRHEDAAFFDCKTWIKQVRASEQDGTAGNYYEIVGNLGSGTDHVAEIAQLGSTFDVKLWDYLQAGTEDLFQFNLESYNAAYDTKITEAVRRGPLLRVINPEDPSRVRAGGVNVEREEYQFGSALPTWLGLSGSSASVAYGQRRVTLSTGASSGDTATLEPDGNIFAGYPGTPWLWGTLTNPPASGGLARFGLRDLGGSARYEFVADPDDTLGTGITNNWIVNVVENDGTVNTREDTGTANYAKLGVAMGGPGRVRFSAEEGRVADVDLSTTTRNLAPHISVETTEASSKSVEVTGMLGYQHHLRP